ncbi:hypothetical protein PENTCL1PPCAC_19648, partial [Pristionchus entomophagus]
GTELLGHCSRLHRQHSHQFPLPRGIPTLGDEGPGQNRTRQIRRSFAHYEDSDSITSRRNADHVLIFDL